MVRDFHLLQDGGTVVCDCDVSIGGDEDLVEATGSKGALDDVCDRSCGENVRLDGLVAKLPLLLALAVRSKLVGVHRELQKGLTHSRTTMNGLPCSSFVTTATASCQYGLLARSIFDLVRTIRQVQVWEDSVSRCEI